jgi:alpha-glucosidase (family GH31 glycosyl hydrolase)
METNNTIYMEGKEADIFVKWPSNMEPYDRDQLNGGDMLSWCWPNAKIAYPDFMNEKSYDWWAKAISDFIANKANGKGTDIAGLWIDMKFDKFK